MELADIGEQAETFTVLVGCWEGFAEPEQTTAEPEKTKPDDEPEPEDTEPDEPTEPDEKVTIEKKEGDACPDGQIQTYKGCIDIENAEAEATAALAAAKARAKDEAITATESASESRNCNPTTAEIWRSSFWEGGTGSAACSEATVAFRRPCNVWEQANPGVHCFDVPSLYRAYNWMTTICYFPEYVGRDFPEKCGTGRNYAGCPCN
jgi:hypothetical protein